MTKRVGQRWMPRAASVLLLLVVGLILAGGCTADTSTTAGEDRTGEAKQGLLCECRGLKLWCGESACGVLTCGIDIGSSECCVYEPDPRMEGERCLTEGPSGQRFEGVCAQGQCCTGCLVVPDGAPVCGGNGTSVSACGPIGEKCQNCNDGDTCTTDSCVEGRCVNDPLPDGTSCMGGKCVGGVCCSGCVNASGVCVNAPNALNCGSGAGACVRCEDNLPCTANVCNAGSCVFPAVPNNTGCPNSTVCDGDETCQTGVCQVGTSLNCNDNNVCTSDTCNAASGCAHTNITGSCNDGDACTDGDSCAGGNCAGSAITCNDQNPCTADTCNGLQGCVFTPLMDNTPCEDGNECSTASVCLNSVCTVTQGVSCEDNRQCTQNDCDPSTQACANTPQPNDTPCSDNDACTQGDSCQGGDCAPGPALSCDDNDPCTDDRCDPLLGCQHTDNSSGSCNDLNPCTAGDHCSEGNCLPGQNKACPETECQEAGTCQTDTGLCDNVNKDDGTPCTGGSCRAGVCTPTPPGDGGAGAAGAAGTAGAAGATAGMGGQAGAGADTGGAAGTAPGTGGSSGTGGNPGDRIFERDPGGCSCRTTSPSTDLGLGWLSLLVASGLGLRRRVRRAVTHSP